MPNWTDNQKKAIELFGNNIIVSAGAGSGKTAVLTERVINHLKNGININELLILTFTKAAAQEMKNRIRTKLQKDNNANQLSLINSAFITTFDSFALSIVKRYNYVLNIPTNISITPDSVINVATKSIIDDVFEKRYISKDLDFLKLINDFCFKNDDNIKNAIYEFNLDFDKKVYKNKELDCYFSNYFSNDFINKTIVLSNEIILKRIENLKPLLVKLLCLASSKNQVIIKEIIDIITNNKHIEKRIEALLIGLPRKDTDCEDSYSEKKEQINKEIKDIINCYSLRDDKKKVNEFSLIKENVKVIISLIKEVGERLELYKQENNLFTFYDIAKKAIAIVKNHKEIREELKNEFKEIMIDEYQDTSDIQEELINLIANHNVYMVGDIKQSIYGFRNANPNLFKTKYESFSSNPNELNSLGIRIDLLENFRSRSDNVKAVNEIFSLTMNNDFGGIDYLKGHKMIQGNKLYDASPVDIDYSMEVLSYDNDLLSFPKAEKEAYIIANDIIEKKKYFKVLDKETGKYRNCINSDFAILIDRRRDFDIFKKMFEYFDIPLKVFQDENLNNGNTLRIVNNIIKFILKVREPIDNEMKYLFTSIARSYLFCYDDDYIYKCLKNNDINKTTICSLAKELNEVKDLYTISDFIDKIISKFKIFELVNTIGGVDNLLAEIKYLKELGKSFGKIENGIGDFSLFLDKVIDENISLDYSTVSEDLNAVSIMTIHKSKGLEFGICYYCGLYSKFNNGDIKSTFLYDNSIGIVIPYLEYGEKQTFLKDICKYNYKTNEIAERIRLFYVALTRAKEKIILVDEKKNIEKDCDDYFNGLSHNSFQSIMGSIYGNINFKIFECDKVLMGLNKEYRLSRNLNLDNIVDKPINNVLEVIKTKEVRVTFEKEEKHERFSKDNKGHIESNETKQLKKLGTGIHEFLELVDFNDLDSFDNKKLPNLYIEILDKFKKMPLIKNKKYENIYKEYQFIYNDVIGIIDLLLETNDEFLIFDYKLKNISDDAYINQLHCYRDYLNSVSDKNVKMYLYSLIDGILIEIK